LIAVHCATNVGVESSCTLSCVDSGCTQFVNCREMQADLNDCRSYQKFSLVDWPDNGHASTLDDRHLVQMQRCDSQIRGTQSIHHRVTVSLQLLLGDCISVLNIQSEDMPYEVHWLGRNDHHQPWILVTVFVRGLQYWRKIVESLQRLRFSYALLGLTGKAILFGTSHPAGLR